MATRETRKTIEPMTRNDLPLACDMTAIPLADRPGHARLARSLFGALDVAEPVDRGEEEGLRIDLPASALSDVARWTVYERLCCPFLHFTIDVEPAADAITLTLSGPIGTRAFLKEELR